MKHGCETAAPLAVPLDRHAERTAIITAPRSAAASYTGMYVTSRPLDWQAVIGASIAVLPQ
jgi:hypothetical protein